MRFNSAYSLELLGPLAKEAGSALKIALNDSDPEVRRKALDALQKIDPAGFKSAE
jgi:HEAT repeat protein